MSTKLLPRTVDQFADEGFWRKFFLERGDNSFEWYGDFNELKSALQRYLKATDRILHVGCGNSVLADQLYDDGFREVTSIDVVDDVIKLQKKRNRKKRPELIFHRADVTQLDFPNSQFNVVLDKGTLDALLPDYSEHHVSKVRSMFDEINRCLANGGRYLVISLAQELILQTWFSYFSSHSFLLRVHQIANRIQAKQQIFILVATKLKPGLPAPEVFEFVCGSATPHRFSSIDNLIDAVKAAQQYGYFCHRASLSYLEEELHIQLYGASDPTSPRYDVRIVQKMENSKSGLPYAVFIIPQGRETHWHFTSAKGRQEICKAADCRRLAIVALCRGQTFNSLSDVKSELNDVVLHFAPEYLKNVSDVLYLSLGDDYLGERHVKQVYTSSINGEFVVEDVRSRDTDETLRRLVFVANQNVVQSEVPLKKVAGAKEEVYNFDWSNLACLHHRAMMAALAMCCDDFIEARLNICIVGVGGGCLATFLRKHFPHASILGIELDLVVIEAARKWFDFRTDEQLTCVIDDGLEFLKKAAIDKLTLFDVIIFDVGGASHVDGLSCPPPGFLTDECLSNARSLLSDRGSLAINLVCRDAEKTAEIKEKISETFETVVSHGITDMVNELLICLPRKPDDLSMYNEVVQQRLARLYEYLVEIGNSGSSGVEKTVERMVDDLNSAIDKIVNC